MTTAEALFDPTPGDEDYPPGDDPGPRTRGRSREETLALAEEIQAAEPGITHADVARRLGISPNYFRKLRNGRVKTTAGAAKSAGKAGGVKPDALAAKLCDPLAKLAMGLAFAVPTVAAVLIERGEVTARAIVDIAADHPRMLAALEKISTAAAASELVQTGAMIVIAASLDLGRMPPEHPIAALTGVSALYARVHPEPPPSAPAMTIPFPVPVPGAPVG